MEKNKYKLGILTEEYNEINVEGELNDISYLQGINNEKYFQESNSNKNDIDLLRYKICRNNTFAYNKATSRNGERISIAYRTDGDCLVSPSYICFKVVRKDLVLDDYLMLWFRRPVFDRYVRFNSWGSATEFFTYSDFAETEIELPSIEEQEKIVRQYKIIHQRLAILYKKKECINNLIYTLFEEKVLNHKFFIEEPINTNISFVNGLAMQNFRPESNQKSLPVIKIRELTQRKCDNKSEKCISTIPEKVLISSGDLVFSWSATLLIDYWNAETAGLNQHLFKVTSKKYPRWFCFNWINYHLNRFRTIAENKGTTFGHITKDDLDKSIIKIPNNLEEIKGIFNPLERQYEIVCRQIYLIEKLKENFENLII